MFSRLKYIFLFPALLFSFSGFSQLNDAQSNLDAGKDLNVLYRNEANFGLLAHSSGVGFNFRRCRRITGTKKGIMEMEFVNMKSPKEVKVSNPNFDNSKGFVYGKMNAFQILRPGVGYQQVLFEKAERKSVEIRLGTYVGCALGITKPIYLEILHEIKGQNGNYTLSEEQYKPNEHYIDDIYGRAPYHIGLSQTRIHPGGYAKLALSFEYADFHDDVKSIETGVILDAFPNQIPIMAFNKNQQFFLTFYVSMIYGKKWL